FIMKKTLLGSLILLAFAGNVQAARNPIDSETAGTVTFFGKVVENTCKVKTESKDRSVTLNDVGKANLANQGETAMPTPFTITLQDCSANNPGANSANKVGLYFYSWNNTDEANSYTLKNTKEAEQDGARKVNIQLFEANGTDEIKVVGRGTTDFTSENTGSASNITNKHISGSTQLQNTGDINLQFIAQYYATGTNTTQAGKVQSSVDFQIAYE
uniref:fimbrial protein n=2 Tax=Haemophilus influenzae TaxID=727 RepID=UPI00215916A5